MNTPVVVWIAIIGLFTAIIIAHFTVEMVKHFHAAHTQGIKIFQTGSEREEFFVPGDPTTDDEDLLYDED